MLTEQNNSLADRLDVPLDDGSTVTLCPELIDNSRRPTPARSAENNDIYFQELARLAAAANLYSYDTLHADGHCLISSWFARAVVPAKSTRQERETSFDRFIYAWIAFNGWASRVTGLSRDAEIIESLSLNRDLCWHFQEQFQSDSFRYDLQCFANFWPIFSAKDLRAEQIIPDQHETRAETIQHYFQSWQNKMAAYSLKAREFEKTANDLTRQAHNTPEKADRLLKKAAELQKQSKQYHKKSTMQIEHAPACMLRHQPDPTNRRAPGPRFQDPLPDYLDWPHTLAAIYQVRCNLFHGEKSRNSENDQAIVFAAYRVLTTFMQSFKSPWDIRPVAEVCKNSNKRR